MDTDHRNVPGEEFLDLALDRPADAEPDGGGLPQDEQEETIFLAALDDVATGDADTSAPVIDGLEPASVGGLDLGDSLYDEPEDPGFLPALDDVVTDDDDSSTPEIEGLLQLTDDVWGADRGETADLVPAPADEDLAVAGLAVEAPADEDADPLFPALPAPTGQPSSRQTARRSVRDVWAGMAPSRRQAVGVAGSAIVAVALVGAAWVQRPDVSEDVMSTGTLQTTSSVAVRRTPPTSTVAPASDTSAPAADPSEAPAADVPGPPAGNNPAPPTPAVPSASGAPASPRVTAAGVAPSAPAPPATQAPARVDTTPATRAVETTAPPATAAPAPVVPETTETTRRFREPPTTVELPTPTSVVLPENPGSVPCSPYIARGPLACPPEQ